MAGWDLTPRVTLSSPSILPVLYFRPLVLSYIWACGSDPPLTFPPPACPQSRSRPPQRSSKEPENSLLGLLARPVPKRKALRTMRLWPTPNSLRNKASDVLTTERQVAKPEVACRSQLCFSSRPRSSNSLEGSLLMHPILSNTRHTNRKDMCSAAFKHEKKRVLKYMEYCNILSKELPIEVM